MRFTHRIRQHMGTLILICCFLWTVIVILFIHDREFMPRCIIHHITGYDCPACGIQRMTECLIHGDFTNIIYYNPYIILISPYLLSLLAAEIWSRRIPKFKAAIENHATILFFFATMIAWWIFRNTEFWHSIADSHISM